MGGTLLNSMPELMEWGVRGPTLPRARAMRLRLLAVIAFLALWSLLSALVIVLRLFNPIAGHLR